MSLPPALLQRLAQRGLVQKQKNANTVPAENEEVIAEDYDELEHEPIHDTEEEYQYPPLYDNEKIVRKPDDSFWLERMRARMGEGNSYSGYKGCPNKYNIYHKCTLFCVNRWEDGHTEPSHDYMRRFKRMLRKYPLPKGWTEHYDPGCGVYYFANEADGVVSWLSPTHPKSVITKSAAVIRRKMDENNGENMGSDGEEESDDSSDSDAPSAYKSTHRSRSPPQKLSAQDFPSLHETLNSPPTSLRRQKSRELDRKNSRRHDRDSDQEHERERNRDRGVERPRERERARGRERDRYIGGHRGRARDGGDTLDPMDPSAYSDIPRGKWSDGLQVGSEKAKKSDQDSSDRRHERRDKRDSRSGEESDLSN